MLADEFWERLWAKGRDKESRKNWKNSGFPLKVYGEASIWFCEETILLQKKKLLCGVQKSL